MALKRTDTADLVPQSDRDLIAPGLKQQVELVGVDQRRLGRQPFTVDLERDRILLDAADPTGLVAGLDQQSRLDAELLSALQWHQAQTIHRHSDLERYQSLWALCRRHHLPSLDGDPRPSSASRWRRSRRCCRRRPRAARRGRYRPAARNDGCRLSGRLRRVRSLPARDRVASRPVCR